MRSEYSWNTKKQKCDMRIVMLSVLRVFDDCCVVIVCSEKLIDIVVLFLKEYVLIVLVNVDETLW